MAHKFNGDYMQINFNKPLLDLNGNAIIDKGKAVQMNVLISNILCGQQSSKDAAKILSLAINIRNSENEIQLSMDDLKIIKDAVIGSKLTVLVAGQILKYLEENNGK